MAFANIDVHILWEQQNFVLFVFRSRRLGIDYHHMRIRELSRIILRNRDVNKDIICIKIYFSNIFTKDIYK